MPVPTHFRFKKNKTCFSANYAFFRWDLPVVPRKKRRMARRRGTSEATEVVDEDHAAALGAPRGAGAEVAPAAAAFPWRSRWEYV